MKTTRTALVLILSIMLTVTMMPISASAANTENLNEPSITRAAQTEIREVPQEEQESPQEESADGVTNPRFDELNVMPRITKKQAGKKATKELRNSDLVEQYDVVEESCSYTLTKNDDGDDTYTLDIGPGEAYEDTIYITDSFLYDHKETITRIIVADGIKTIGYGCFDGFSNLETVRLPETLEVIEAYAFRSCRYLHEINVPAGLTEIGDNAFYDCKCINGLKLPSSVKTVGEGAFSYCGCGPSSVTLPDGFCQDPLERAKIYYDVKGSWAVSPDTPDRDYIEQFVESYIKMQEVLDGLNLEGKSDYMKIKTIYDWVTANVRYDYDAIADGASFNQLAYAATAHSALFAKKAVCSGYTDLIKMMLNESGIKCTTCGGGNHVWQVVELDGKWYACDATWDEGKEDIKYKYFLRTYEWFIENGHTWVDNGATLMAMYPTSDTTTTGYGFFSSEDGNFEYLLNGENIVLTKINSDAQALTLPTNETYNGVSYPITAVGVRAAEENKSMQTLVIPEGYTRVEWGAFLNCQKLKVLSLPSTLVEISDYVFFNDPLEKASYSGTKAQFAQLKYNKKENYNLAQADVSCSDGIYKTPYILENGSIKLSKTKFVYNGTVQIPAITVTAADGTILKKDTDYSIRINDSAKCSPKNVDYYDVEVFGKGDYNGYLCKSFKIVPKATSIRSVKAGSKSFTVKWYKRTAQVKGYQVQYATNSKFTKGVKTVRVTTNGTTSRTIKKLKAKKTYYVRVRTYKSGSYYCDTHYSAWSDYKKITTKL